MVQTSIFQWYFFEKRFSSFHHRIHANENRGNEKGIVLMMARDWPSRRCGGLFVAKQGGDHTTNTPRHLKQSAQGSTQKPKLKHSFDDHFIPLLFPLDAQRTRAPPAARPSATLFVVDDALHREYCPAVPPGPSPRHSPRASCAYWIYVCCYYLCLLLDVFIYNLHKF